MKSSNLIGAESNKESGDKTRFILPLAQLMMDCSSNHGSSTSAVQEEIMTSFVHRATRVAESSEIPTLQRAITTSGELREYLTNKEEPMHISSLEPLVLEQFLSEARSHGRAVHSVNWLNKKLQLGWPLDKVEELCVKKSSHIGTQRSQARTAQPGMMQALETRLIASAEANDPTWLAPVASWLQAMGNLRTMQVTCDSQVKPASNHNKDKQSEAVSGEPPPPNETPAGMSLPNQALMALFNQQAFFELCPLYTVARLASTGTMTQEPAAAAHLTARTAFPRQLNGILLHPESRWGQRYCADFQAGTCQEEDPCRSGAHRCAALFKSGRICHGKHAGSKCCCTRKHASLADLGNRGEPVREATLLTWREYRETQNPGSGGHGDRRYEATHRRDEVETRQQQKRRGIVAGERLEKGGTWGERRQPGIPSRSTTSATTEAIHRGWSHPSAVQKSTGHRANIEAASTMAELCLTGGNEVYIHCASGTSRAPFAAALLAYGIMAAAPSQAPGIDSSSPADYTTAMCIQCEVEPGMDWPLGLLCERCYSQLSEAVPQAQGAP